MAITIGSNSASFRAQRQLASAGDGVARSFERLSSGQRINRASDDAAGISIADRLGADSRLQSQAIRNINDGISIISIVDSALQSQSNIIGRMNELAEQAASGTYSSEQREALSVEYIQLRKELARIAETTAFNGQSLLSTRNAVTGQKIGLQAGIDGSLNSLLQIPNISTGATTGSIDVTWMQGYGVGTEQIDLSIGDTYASLNDLLDSLSARGVGTANQLVHVPTTLANGETKDYYYLMTGFGGAGGKATGILFERTSSGEMVAAANYVEFDISAEGDRFTSVVSLAGGNTLDLRGLRFERGGLEVDRSNPDRPQPTFVRDDTFTNLESTGLENAERARAAIDITSNRIKQLSSLRGEIGAVESRLTGAVSVLAVQRENFLAAESRIRDVDVAEESALLIAKRTSQQVAIAVLAQANRQPQLALQLLQ